MFDFLSFFTWRAVIVMFSTTFSILVVMLMLNIITVNDVVTILHLDEESATVLRSVVGRMQEAATNILDILSQLVNKLFSWAGVDVDLNKIKIDVHTNPGPAQDINNYNNGDNNRSPN